MDNSSPKVKIRRQKEAAKANIEEDKELEIIDKGVFLLQEDQANIEIKASKKGPASVQRDLRPVIFIGPDSKILSLTKFQNLCRDIAELYNDGKNYSLEYGKLIIDASYGLKQPEYDFILSEHLPKNLAQFISLQIQQYKIDFANSEKRKDKWRMRLKFILEVSFLAIALGASVFTQSLSDIIEPDRLARFDQMPSKCITSGFAHYLFWSK